MSQTVPGSLTKETDALETAGVFTGRATELRSVLIVCHADVPRL